MTLDDFLRQQAVAGLEKRLVLLKDRKFNALTWDIAGGLRMSN